MLRAFKKRQAGVTLFEVLLVLFVAAFIAAAVATIYGKVTLTFKQNQLQTAVQQLAANVTATYSSSSGANYTGLAADAVIKGGLAPEDMHVGTTPVNPWMSSNGWAIAAGTGSPPSNYTITLYGIPAGACSTLYQSLSKISVNTPMTINSASNVTTAGAALAACVQDQNTIILYVN